MADYRKWDYLQLNELSARYGKEIRHNTDRFVRRELKKVLKDIREELKRRDAEELLR